MVWVKIKSLLSWHKLNNWLIYSFALGLLPILLRLLTHANHGIPIYSMSDFVFLGLSIAFGNINEIVSVLNLEAVGQKTKTMSQLFMSLNVILLVTFSFLTSSILSSEKIHVDNLWLNVSLILVGNIIIATTSIFYYMKIKNFKV